MRYANKLPLNKNVQCLTQMIVHRKVAVESFLPNEANDRALGINGHLVGNGQPILQAEKIQNFGHNFHQLAPVQSSNFLTRQPIVPCQYSAQMFTLYVYNVYSAS